MADLNSVEEVEVEDYVVRVGKSPTGYEAAVIGVKGTEKEKEQMGSPFMFTMKTKQVTEDVDAPVMIAGHRWVAIGLAVEAYEWRHTNVEPSFDGLDETNVSDIDAEDLIEAIESQSVSTDSKL